MFHVASLSHKSKSISHTMQYTIHFSAPSSHYIAKNIFCEKGGVRFNTSLI